MATLLQIDDLTVGFRTEDGTVQAVRGVDMTIDDGDVLVIPFGASLYFNLIDWDNWNLILETGLQYALVDSNVSARDDVRGRDYDIDIDNAVLWTLGLEYEYMVAENLYVLGGIGYQTDVLGAETDYDGVDNARDTSFQGAYVRLGAKYLF